MKIHIFRPILFFAALALLPLAAPSSASAQDDIYSNVRFVNQGEKEVEIAVWNPRRDERVDRWKVGPGKSLDLADEKGEKLLSIGIISSFIKVGDAPEKSIRQVATRNEKGWTVVWNGKDFVIPVPD